MTGWPGLEKETKQGGLALAEGRGDQDAQRGEGNTGLARLLFASTYVRCIYEKAGDAAEAPGDAPGEQGECRQQSGSESRTASSLPKPADGILSACFLARPGKPVPYPKRAAAGKARAGLGRRSSSYSPLNVWSCHPSQTRRRRSGPSSSPGRSPRQPRHD